MVRLPGIALAFFLVYGLFANGAQARCHQTIVACQSACPAPQYGMTSACTRECRSIVIVCEAPSDQAANGGLPESNLPGNRLPQSRLPASHLPDSFLN